MLRSCLAATCGEKGKHMPVQQGNAGVCTKRHRSGVLLFPVFFLGVVGAVFPLQFMLMFNGDNEGVPLIAPRAVSQACKEHCRAMLAKNVRRIPQTYV